MNKYFYFATLHGLTRTLVYSPNYRVKENKKERPLLYTEIMSRVILNSIMNVYFVPYTFTNDIENIERTIRKMPKKEPFLFANNVLFYDIFVPQ